MELLQLNNSSNSNASQLTSRETIAKQRAQGIIKRLSLKHGSYSLTIGSAGSGGGGGSRAMSLSFASSPATTTRTTQLPVLSNFNDIVRQLDNLNQPSIPPLLQAPTRNYQRLENSPVMFLRTNNNQQPQLDEKRSTNPSFLTRNTRSLLTAHTVSVKPTTATKKLQTLQHK